MELARRSRGDELLKPGAMIALRQRIRRLAPQHDLVSVIACAFNHKTRMLPFIYADTRMAPAGVRAIGSALVDVGFEKTRIVLQQWNPNFRPSQMKLDGRIPDLFLVSTMGMHSACALELMNDCRRVPAELRPLIIAGGSHAVYQSELMYSQDPSKPAGPDVVVTGEEYIFLSLLEVLLTLRSPGESMRSVFLRARDSGAIDHIPGLIYPLGPSDGATEELVDTGVQQLLGDLDELPHPVLGYTLLETPGRSATLAPQAMPASLVRKHSPISSLVMTFGCKFACTYCPIPAYNQRQHRLKSPQRIADEMHRLNASYGLKYFFGTDDNFFNAKQRTLDIIQTLVQYEPDGNPLRKRVKWATEVTVHDTLLMREHLPLMRRAGARALWLGVEDLTATLVKKGQSVSKTREAFGLLCENGIAPMPMMMHHDSQPLISRNGPYGLINQVNILRKAGAMSLQVLMLTPSPGTKLFEGTYDKGMVIASAGGRKVEQYMADGNHVIASELPRPWHKQINMLLGYLFFYNPIWLIVHLVRPHKRLGFKPALMQIIGMMGLIQNYRRTLGWAMRLAFGTIEREMSRPHSTIPVRSLSETPAAQTAVTITINIPAKRLAAETVGTRHVTLPVAQPTTCADPV